MRWNMLNNDADINKMSETLGISAIAARILANRNIRTKNTALKFLSPKTERQADSLAMKDFDKAARIILRAREKGVKTAVFGDYDVDGVMSSAIMYKTLKILGMDVVCYTPHREEEGYGLSSTAVEKLVNDGVKLIISCDNGIAAIDEAELAKRLSAALIVIDHHEPRFSEENGSRKDVLPAANAIIDPKQQACGYQFKQLCAAGLCYKFSEYLHKLTKISFDSADEFLALAGIATFCDIVDLVDENRILAKNSTRIINENKHGNIGLSALMDARGLSTVGEFEIGFLIGPCINACGRIGHAKQAVKLFTTTDAAEAQALAQTLTELNEQRKAMTAKAAEEALATLSKQENVDKVVVLYLPNTHESIAGIVAGRIKEKLYRPTIVLTNSANDLIKGSGRSIPPYNIFEELLKVSSLTERFGGHAMAAGITLKKENVDILRDKLNANCTLTDEDLESFIDIDAQLEFEDVTFKLAQELEILSPFGKENPAPVFCSYGVITDMVELCGADKKTLKFTFNVDGRRKIKAFCFGMSDKFLERLEKTYAQKIFEGFRDGLIKRIMVKMDIVYNVEINVYNGVSSVQLRVIDFAF